MAPWRFTCGFQRTTSPSTVTVWEQIVSRHVKMLVSKFSALVSLLMERLWTAPLAVRGSIRLFSMSLSEMGTSPQRAYQIHFSSLNCVRCPLTSPVNETGLEEAELL